MTFTTHRRPTTAPRQRTARRAGMLVIVVGAPLVALWPTALQAQQGVVRGAERGAEQGAQRAAQPAGRSSAWSLPDPNGLVAGVIRRIVRQDKPGGVQVADYPERAFGREETVTAVRAFAGRTVGLSPTVFDDVATWPVARATDTLPCTRSATAPAGQPAPCVAPNALWLAVTKLERGDLPHELHVWYATRFRTDAQGSVQSSTYSFCERWLRVGGVWKYDGFVRVSQGIVTP